MPLSSANRSSRVPPSGTSPAARFCVFDGIPSSPVPVTKTTPGCPGPTVWSILRLSALRAVGRSADRSKIEEYHHGHRQFARLVDHEIDRQRERRVVKEVGLVTPFSSDDLHPHRAPGRPFRSCRQRQGADRLAHRVGLITHCGRDAMAIRCRARRLLRVIARIPLISSESHAPSIVSVAGSSGVPESKSTVTMPLSKTPCVISGTSTKAKTTTLGPTWTILARHCDGLYDLRRFWSGRPSLALRPLLAHHLAAGNQQPSHGQREGEQDHSQNAFHEAWLSHKDPALRVRSAKKRERIVNVM